MTQLWRCSPTLATPERCKDAKELKERLTAWPLKVAEYEHQFKTIHEAQKMFAVRKMMPKDIKWEFLTGPMKFDEILEKLEIIVNEMMADDGPVLMDLVKGAGKNGPNESGTWHRGKGADEWPSGKRDDGGKKGGKKGSKVANPIGTVTRTKGAREKGKGKGKSETRYCYGCGEHGHIGVNCPYKWANSIDEEDDHT